MLIQFMEFELQAKNVNLGPNFGSRDKLLLCKFVERLDVLDTNDNTKRNVWVKFGKNLTIDLSVWG